jgi:hypothetical protein
VLESMLYELGKVLLDWTTLECMFQVALHRTNVHDIIYNNYHQKWLTFVYTDAIIVT